MSNVVQISCCCYSLVNENFFVTLQTGSGKTYTMGTAFDVSGENDELVGIVPRAVEHLFIGIQQRQQAALEKGTVPPEFRVNAQFMEVLQCLKISSIF